MYSLLEKKVLAFIGDEKFSGCKDGCSFDEIALELSEHHVNSIRFVDKCFFMLLYISYRIHREALEHLLGEEDIFTTKDEEHFCVG